MHYKATEEQSKRPGQAFQKCSYLHEDIMRRWLKSYGGQYYWSDRPYKNDISYKKLNSFSGLLQGFCLKREPTLYTYSQDFS